MNNGRLVSERPFRAPHHTISPSGLVGGGPVPRPGEITLAHHGVLFMDELPEFARHALEALRQPLEEGRVWITRGQRSLQFPSDFMLVAAANECPCARADGECRCSEVDRLRYARRLSGPLLDRIDLKARLKEVTRIELRYDLELAESSEVVAKRVLVARDRTRRRLAGMPWRTNADIPGRELRRRFAPPHQALAALDQPLADGRLSARGLDRVIRVAWTLTDLAGKDAPTANEVNEALGLWLGLSP
jgi:magnesium chelatase family protein